jgi:MFS family permease
MKSTSDGADFMLRRTVRQFLTLDATHTTAHAVHLSSLVITVASATGSLRLAAWAFVIQQVIEPVAELITGHFADRSGRKKSVVRGFLLSGLGGGLFCISTAWPDACGRYEWALLGAAQAAYLFGSAYLNGALEAWMVDGVSYYGGKPPPDLGRIFSFLAILNNVGMTIGGLIGLSLAMLTKAFWLPWLLLCGGMLVLALVAAVSMNEPYRLLREVRPERSTFLAALSDMVRTIRTNASLFNYTVGWASQYASSVVLAYFWIEALGAMLRTSARMTAASIPAYIATAWFCWCVVRIFAAYYVTGYVSSKRSLGHLLLLASLGCILPLYAFAMAYWFSTVEGIYKAHLFALAIIVAKGFDVMLVPLRSVLINNAIRDSALRALCLSAGSALGAVAALFTVFLFTAVRLDLPSSESDLVVWIAISALVGLLGPFLYARELRSGSSGPTIAQQGTIQTGPTG